MYDNYNMDSLLLFVFDAYLEVYIDSDEEFLDDLQVDWLRKYLVHPILVALLLHVLVIVRISCQGHNVRLLHYLMLANL